MNLIRCYVPQVVFQMKMGEFFGNKQLYYVTKLF